MIRIRVATCIVLLSACAGPQKKSSAPPDNHLWQQHRAQMAAISQWDVRGRVSISTDTNGGQADLFWNQQNSQNYDIRLVAPLGGGSSHLQGRPAGVVLTLSDGTQVFDQNPDALLERVQGWHFPVSGLRYWMLGLPSPQSVSRILNWTEQGYPELIEQDGWRIEIRSYTQVGAYTLPKKLFIHRRNNEEEVDVRLVFSQWGLTDD